VRSVKREKGQIARFIISETVTSGRPPTPYYEREVLLEGKTEPEGAIRKGLDSGGDLGSRQGRHGGSWAKFRR
jgi:hypothetical protein